MSRRAAYRRFLRFARSVAIALASVVAVFVLADAASACPTCSQALADNHAGGDPVSGYFWSIVFMMSMPFTILTVFGLTMYYKVRKARAAGMTQTHTGSKQTEAVNRPTAETGSTISESAISESAINGQQGAPALS